MASPATLQLQVDKLAFVVQMSREVWGTNL